MPRIYHHSGPIDPDDPDDPGADSDPIDYCQGCYDDGLDSRAVWDLDEEDAEHPPYDETDYRCRTCDAKLTSADDWAA